MRILYFGVYEPSYARNWVLINGLRKNGVDVLELRQRPGRFALLKLFFGYLKFKKDYDAMIVGFPGQEVMFLARFLTRKPIIFDAFTSHYGGYILDRKKWAKNSLRAKYFKFLDKWSCKLADVVLLDTSAHIDFFVGEFSLTREKFRRIWIGANDENFKPAEDARSFDGKFRVIFFGTYVPLQGAEYIVRAAKILENEEDTIFQFIGKGQDKPKSIELAKELGLKNIEFTDMMKPENLKIEIARSDVVLGLFGDTPKTPLVIPNKVYEALAMKKPVITADTKAIRELFDENDMYLVKPADPEDLAKAIMELKNNSELRRKLAENGYKKFKENASHKVLGAELLKIDLLLNNFRKENLKF
ncbi:MAG: glycosyltransferase family 4 protein [Candidatus Staskawiczbacteria bacterium]|nr:glycosyltransferase family 4 protein [Candidatus Staskawiczbacteria bacterium]